MGSTVLVPSVMQHSLVDEFRSSIAT